MIMEDLKSQEAAAIVSNLLEATRGGRRKWDVWGATEFQAKSGRFAYYIGARDGDDRPPFDFEIWLRKNPPERAESAKVAVVSTQPGSELNPLLTELYQAAKLSAFGIESLAKDVLADLEKPES